MIQITSWRSSRGAISMATNQNPQNSPNTTISIASKSSEIVGSNDDLLKQILVKLPLKSLAKFTSVSKHWLSLISDPDFSRSCVPFPCSISGLFLENLFFGKYEFIYLNQSSNPPNPPFRSLNFINNFSRVQIHQSCNGLLLFSSDRGQIEYWVCNPTTEKYTLLPLRRSRMGLGLSLAFDPSKSPHYKVLRFLKIDAIDDEDHYQIQIELYSSITGTWRLSGDSFYAHKRTQFGDGVFWNGAVHWLSFEGPFLYFNVDEELLGQMPEAPNPDDYLYKSDLRYFGASGGHLHLVNYFFCPTAPVFEVYEMTMDYSNWFVKFRVDFSQLPTKFPEILNWDHCGFAIFYIFHGDVDEESHAVIRFPEKFIRYNFESKDFHKLCDMEDGDALRFTGVFSNARAHQYIESLALV